jgi:hypothetical protein
MWHDHPLPSADPASTPTSRLLARILMIWTGVLTVLVVTGMRSLPPTLTGLLLSYLALVTWHLLARSGPRPANPQPSPSDSASVPIASLDAQVVGGPPSGGPDERVESSGSLESSLAREDTAGLHPVIPRKARGRRRGKPMSPPGPVPASWVQIGPGKYIRGEEPDPAPAGPSVTSVEGAPETSPSGKESSHEVARGDGLDDRETGTSPIDAPDDSAAIGDGDGIATVPGGIDLPHESFGVPHREDAVGGVISAGTSGRS